MRTHEQTSCTKWHNTRKEDTERSNDNSLLRMLVTRPVSQLSRRILKAFAPLNTVREAEETHKRDKGERVRLHKQIP